MAAAVEDNDDYSVPDLAFHGPAKALEAAQNQEHARVTLFRAVRTLVHMLGVRGYTVTHIADKEVTDGDAAKAACVYEDPDLASSAETDHAIVLRAEVREQNQFTTAWAQNIPVGSALLVIIITKGNVGVMREVLKTLEDSGVLHVILISRFPLTPYSKKWISECKDVHIEFFTLMALQAPIDRHKLTPKHVPLNGALSTVVRERYRGGHFPKLLLSDPMVQFLGLTSGTLVTVKERMGREQAVVSFFEVAEM